MQNTIKNSKTMNLNPKKRHKLNQKDRRTVKSEISEAIRLNNINDLNNLFHNED